MRFDLSFSFSFVLAAFSLLSFAEFAESSATAPLDKRSPCKQFSTTFSSSSDVSSTEGDAPFVAISPEGTYAVTDAGLRLDLQKPQGTVTSDGETNNVLGQGATVNSTFMFRYGVTTFQIEAPSVAGVVVAGILIADDGDEIDVELVCGDPTHWQTNIFAPQKTDQETIFGVFGGVETFADKSDSLTGLHNYTVDWNEDRIIWSVDGKAKRTLKPSQTVVNGTEHYPTGLARISLGIWDASSPVGTSDWGKGPINWNKAPSTISATVRGVWLECSS